MGCTNLFDAISHQFSPILASTEFTPHTNISLQISDDKPSSAAAGDSASTPADGNGDALKETEQKSSEKTEIHCPLETKKEA